MYIAATRNRSKLPTLLRKTQHKVLNPANRKKFCSALKMIYKRITTAPTRIKPIQNPIKISFEMKITAVKIHMEKKHNEVMGNDLFLLDPVSNREICYSLKGEKLRKSVNHDGKYVLLNETNINTIYNTISKKQHCSTKLK